MNGIPWRIPFVPKNDTFAVVFKPHTPGYDGLCFLVVRFRCFNFMIPFYHDETQRTCDLIAHSYQIYKSQFLVLWGIITFFAILHPSVVEAPSVKLNPTIHRTSHGSLKAVFCLS